MRKEKAVEYKHSGNNCCQSVLLAFGDKLDLPEETLKKLGSGFGAGMGTREGVCGALTAAANLLLVDSTVQIDRYTLRSGKPMGERTCCMVAGIHDIWALRPAGDRVLLRTISARALLVMLDQALTQPVGVAPQA